MVTSCHDLDLKEAAKTMNLKMTIKLDAFQ